MSKYKCPECGKEMRLAQLEIDSETKGYECSAWFKCDDCHTYDKFFPIYNASTLKIAIGKAKACYELDLEQWRILNK